MKKSLFPLLALALLLLLYLLLFPPRWYLNLTKRVDVSAETGAALAEKYNCRSCHVIDGRGALKAPNLDDAVKRESEETLARWLANPRATRQRRHAELSPVRQRDSFPAPFPHIRPLTCRENPDNAYDKQDDIQPFDLKNISATLVVTPKPDRL